jgi:PPM family protein phosphatase
MTETSPIDACCQTDTGLKRSQNEDVCAANREYNFYMIADGMGGAAKGDLASKFFLTATENIFTAQEKTPTLKERFYACFDDTEDGDENNQNKSLNLIKDKAYACFENANNTIQEHIKKIPTHAGMGCTAELLTFFEQHYIIGHVGDSRSYILSEGAPLRQITKDHSLIQNQIDNGVIQQKQASNVLNNVLTRAVGVSHQLEVDIISGQTHPGDIFLLCSDGLYNMVTDKEIAEVLVFDAPLELKAEMLINMANDNGGRDNISVTLVQIPTS